MNRTAKITAPALTDAPACECGPRKVGRTHGIACRQGEFLRESFIRSGWGANAASLIEAAATKRVEDAHEAALTEHGFKLISSAVYR